MKTAKLVLSGFFFFGAVALLYAAVTADVYHNGMKVTRVVVVDDSDNVITGFGNPVAGQRTATIVAHTTSGSVAIGCRSLTFIASSDFSGTVLTNFPMAAGAGLTIPVPAGDTLGAVAYTVSTGTLYSVEVR